MDVILLISMIILITLTGVLMILAFIVGVSTAQKAQRGEDVKLPNINPVETYREHKEQVEISKEQERLNTMLENINNYKGDGLGQRDIL